MPNKHLSSNNQKCKSLKKSPRIKAVISVHSLWHFHVNLPNSTSYTGQFEKSKQHNEHVFKFWNVKFMNLLCTTGIQQNEYQHIVCITFYFFRECFRICIFSFVSLNVPTGSDLLAWCEQYQPCESPMVQMK